MNLKHAGREMPGTQTFAAAITCMDGRMQMPVFDWVKRHYQVEFVDMITAAGPVANLAGEGDPVVAANIRRRLEISVREHGSRGVVIAAHAGCAGNPVGKERQLEQLAAAAARVSSWNMAIECVTVWVDDRQEIHRIA